MFFSLFQLFRYWKWLEKNTYAIAYNTEIKVRVAVRLSFQNTGTPLEFYIVCISSSGTPPVRLLGLLGFIKLHQEHTPRPPLSGPSCGLAVVFEVHVSKGISAWEHEQVGSSHQSTVRVKSFQLGLEEAAGLPVCSQLLQHYRHMQQCNRPALIFPHLSPACTTLSVIFSRFSSLWLGLLAVVLWLVDNMWLSFILLPRWQVSLSHCTAPDVWAHGRGRLPCVSACGKAGMSLTTLTAPEKRPQAGCCVKSL